MAESNDMEPKLIRTLFRRENAFPLVIGFTDGILTALTLTAGRVVSATDPIDVGLAFRIAAASAISGLFVFFTAEYVRLRGELVRAERELNLARHGHLATTRLGQAVLRDAARGAVASSTSSFAGALVPLLVGVAFATLPWLSVLVSLAALAVLGVVAARASYANAVLWALALVAAGCVLTAAGVQLRIV
jgi:predicted membrane protein (TIGR00267 family)